MKRGWKHWLSLDPSLFGYLTPVKAFRCPSASPIVIGNPGFLTRTLAVNWTI